MNEESVYHVPEVDRTAFEAVMFTASARVGKNVSWRFPSSEWARVDFSGWKLAEMDLVEAALWAEDRRRGYSGWVL